MGQTVTSARELEVLHRLKKRLCLDLDDLDQQLSGARSQARRSPINGLKLLLARSSCGRDMKQSEVRRWLLSKQTAPLEFNEGPCKTAFQNIEHLVELCAGDHQWRAQRQAVPHRPQDKALLLQNFCCQGADPSGNVKWYFAGFIAHQFQSTDQTDPSRFAHQRMRREIVEPALKFWRYLSYVIQNVALFINFQRLKRHRARHRMSRIREAMGEYSDFFALFHKRLIDFLVDERRRNRLIT